MKVFKLGWKKTDFFTFQNFLFRLYEDIFYFSSETKKNLLGVKKSIKRLNETKRERERDIRKRETEREREIPEKSFFKSEKAL